MLSPTTAIATVFLFFFISSCGHEASHSSDEVTTKNGWIRATPPTATTSAMYLTITNPTKDPLSLIGIKAAVTERIELHNTIQENGQMKMRQVDAIAIPPGDTIDLKPHGHHGMLFDLTEQLSAGTEIEVELEFEKFPAISVTMPVLDQAPGANGTANTKEHSHTN